MFGVGGRHRDLGEDAWSYFEATAGDFRLPAGAWVFCCSPQGHFLSKGNQVVWENLLRTPMVSHDPERAHGLSQLRRPETTGELMQFLQTINWMRMPLPELAELEAPWLLEEGLCNTRRTKRVAALRVLDSSEWTGEHAVAWDAVRLRVSKAVPLNLLKPGFSVMMFPDASDNFWGSCITQGQTVELRSSVAIADMSHEPLGFLSGPLGVRRSDGQLWTRRGSRS